MFIQVIQISERLKMFYIFCCWYWFFFFNILLFKSGVISIKFSKKRRSIKSWSLRLIQFRILLWKLDFRIWIILRLKLLFNSSFKLLFYWKCTLVLIRIPAWSLEPICIIWFKKLLILLIVLVKSFLIIIIEFMWIRTLISFVASSWCKKSAFLFLHLLKN